MKKVFLFVLVFSALIFSCSKETVKTPGQISADEINSIVKQGNIKYVTISDWYGSTSATSGPFTFDISGQYIVTHDNSGFAVVSTYYNLERLSHFQTSEQTISVGPVTVLVLYFK